MEVNQCCENSPELDLRSSYGAGIVENFGNIKVYTNGSPHSKAAVILISDFFGYEAQNLRILADKVVAAGYFSLVPDYFNGDYFVPNNPERPLSAWKAIHGPDKGVENTKPIISALKKKGISSIGAAGFCWGAKVVVELAKSEDIQAGVMFHPAMVTIEDIKEVKSPIAILGAEIDRVSPPELVRQFEEVLSAKPEVGSFVKIFPGVAHGWAVRYETDDEYTFKSAVESHQDMLIGSSNIFAKKKKKKRSPKITS